MAMNSTQVSSFTLAAYMDAGLWKHLCFVVVTCVYALTLAANVLLIVVVCGSRSLQEPMYVFLCSLCANELFGSSGLFPFLLLQILSDTHAVPAPLCFLQVFCLHTYGNIQFFNLAVMSYDRYVAICRPLQYHARMTLSTVAALIALTWSSSVVGVLVMVSLSFSLQLCGNVINKVYCSNYSIVKLACSDTSLNNIYGLITTFPTVFGPVLLILYTYTKILQVCFSGSAQTRHKALSTCTPHLASLLNFTFGSVFEILQSRFNMSGAPKILSILLSVYWLTCQPLFNPVMYGLKMSKIRMGCKSLLLRSVKCSSCRRLSKQ